MIKYGFIGSGSYGSKIIRKAIELSMPISCVYGHANRAELESDVNFVETVDEVIENSDAVIINVPLCVVVAIGTDCIIAGKPCLLSKPIAPSLTGAEKLLELSTKHSIPVMVDHSLCYTSNFEQFYKYRFNCALIRHSRPPSTGKMNIYWNIGIHFIALMDVLGISNYAIELLMSDGLKYIREIDLVGNLGGFNMEITGDLSANTLKHFSNNLEYGLGFRTDIEHAVRVISILESRYGSIDMLRG